MFVKPLHPTRPDEDTPSPWVNWQVPLTEPSQIESPALEVPELTNWQVAHVVMPPTLQSCPSAVPSQVLDVQSLPLTAQYPLAESVGSVSSPEQPGKIG